MITDMKVRCVLFASVSSAFLVASAAASGLAFASSPRSNADLISQAFVALSAGNLDVAVREYSEAIESRTLEPEPLANALLNRGFAHQKLNEHQAAADDYSAALQIDAMSADLRATALYNRGVSFQRLSQLPKAVEDFTSALFLNPQFAQAYYNRGNALRDSGQLLFALSDYDRALRYNHPNMARVHYSAAITHVALRRSADAAKHFKNALAINPAMAEAKAGLEKLGNKQAAVQVAATDDILTGSLSALGGGLVVRKPDLPKAIAPPVAFETGNAASTNEALLAEVSTAKSNKKFNDRIPLNDEVIATVESPKALDGNIEVAVADVPQIPTLKSTTAKTKKTAVVVTPVSAPADVAVEEVSEPTTQSGWAIQLASAGSEDTAWSTWKKMQKQRSALAKLKPVVVRADLGTKGVFYRIRLVGYEDQKLAQAACTKLKGAGVSCYISKANS
jgi:tetratricopeptide (TPR) repeat protein